MRDQILCQSVGNALNEEQLERLTSLNQVLQIQDTTQRNAHTILQGGTGESLGLIGNDISLETSIGDRDAALQTLANIDVPAIQAKMVEMTGYIPTNLPGKTHLFSNPDPSSTQAGIQIQPISSLKFDKAVRRNTFKRYGLHALDALECNADFMREHPNEARGVIFHELGHIWTSKVTGLDTHRSETYIEAFGELFRSAAAMQGNEQWDQAMGCSGIDVLHGSEVPNLVIPHWQNQHVPSHLYHAGRFVVCNKLIEHLGGLDKQKLQCIAKACDAGALPYNGGSFEELLKDIEAATGKTGFANAVLQDPALKYGGMQPGPVVVGLPSVSGNAYRIESFMIKDVGALWGKSKQQFDDEPSGKRTDVNSNTFHFEGVQTEIIPFSLSLKHDTTSIECSMSIDSGSILLSQEQILDIGLKGGAGLPSGTYTFTVEVLGQPPKHIDTTIEITDAFRQDFQRRRNIRFSR